MHRSRTPRTPPAFGDRSNLGERSDTIMMWRVNPSTSQVAVLSFPRDLFVDIAGSSRQGRINEAYERDNPQKLIDTIYQNFGINTDHFVQVDFCAFQTLVDAVDGVAVPFDTRSATPTPGSTCPKQDASRSTATTRSRTSARASCSTSTRTASGSRIRRPTSGGSHASRTS